MISQLKSPTAVNVYSPKCLKNAVAIFTLPTSVSLALDTSACSSNAYKLH